MKIQMRFVISIVLALAACLTGAAVPHAHGSDRWDPHEIRAVHDVATVRLDRIEDDDQSSWALIEIVPDPTSGGAVAKGMHINIDTGELVVGPDARAPIVESGRWVRVATLSGELDAAGRYEWELPTEPRRNLEIADYYSPFADGGLILARVDPDRTGTEQFSFIHLIPAAWEPRVVAASKFYRNERDLFGEGETAGNRERLRQLVADENPLISVMAFRALLDGLENEEYLIRRALTKSRGQKQASLVYLLLTRASASGHDGKAGQAVLEAIGKSDRPSDLGGLALGVLVASMQRHDPAARSWQDRLFGALRDRREELGPDEYVDSILDVVGGSR